MRYAVFDKTTGRIDRIIVAPVGVASASASCRPGEDFVAANAAETDVSHYVSLSAMGLVPFPAAPSPSSSYHWSWQSKAWVLDLAKAKQAKWEDMKAERAAATQAPLATPFGTFDADEKSRTNIAQTAQLIQTQANTLSPGAVPTVDFTLADNSVVTLTAQQMVEVALMLGAQVQAAYARGRVLRDAVDAATTADQLAAITWSTP